MSRFRIGQKVVALKSGPRITKGRIYVVDGFACCENCGDPCIYLVKYSEIADMCCGLCNHNLYTTNITREFFSESIFAPLTSSTDAIEYKMKVSIPELLELTKLQEA